VAPAGCSVALLAQQLCLDRALGALHGLQIWLGRAVGALCGQVAAASLGWLVGSALCRQVAAAALLSVPLVCYTARGLLTSRLYLTQNKAGS